LSRDRDRFFYSVCRESIAKLVSSFVSVRQRDPELMANSIETLTTAIEGV